jgi:phosphatidate phosphatase APP1
MTSWRRILAQLAGDAEAHFDRLKRRLDDRLGNEPIHVVAYNGYGTHAQLVLRGRVLEDRAIRPASDQDSVWRNLINMYRRFESDEIPGAHVRARIGSAAQEVVADEEGYFVVRLPPPRPLPEQLWHALELTLIAPLHPDQPPILAQGQVLIPPSAARFGVISDIDDTVVHTDATSLLRMARTTFLGNAHTRLPFPGVAALYRALSGDPPVNPLFYVSSSPWNLYDMLVDFLALRGIPAGPMLLRDWGMSRSGLLPSGHREHKLAAIAGVMETYPNLPFLLIGDSGQEDPEIYYEVLQRYPGRVPAIYIRNVSREAARGQAIHVLAEQVLAAGSTLILADDTLAAARHAAEQGWIAASALAAIAADGAADAAPADLVESSLDD